MVHETFLFLYQSNVMYPLIIILSTKLDTISNHLYYSNIGLCVIIRALRGTLLKSRGCNPEAAIISDLTSQMP